MGTFASSPCQLVMLLLTNLWHYSGWNAASGEQAQNSSMHLHAQEEHNTANILLLKNKKKVTNISPEHVLISLLTRKQEIVQMYDSLFKLPFSVQFLHGSNKISTCIEHTIFVIDLCAYCFLYMFYYGNGH